MVSNSGGGESEGGGGYVSGVPTTQGQTKVGLIVAIVLGALVIAGAVVVYFVK